MLTTDFQISVADAQHILLVWTAPAASSVSWVFVNGKHARGPLQFATAERSVRIALSSSARAVIEIHDMPNISDVPDPTYTIPNRRPTIIWNAVTDAARYRIYHREADSDEVLIFDKPATQGLSRYEITCPIDLGGNGAVWHSFRVESVDAYGNVSTRDAFSFLLFDLPAMPTEVTITEGSGAGLYDITLEVPSA